MGWTDSYLLEILEQIASRASRWGAFGLARLPLRW